MLFLVDGYNVTMREPSLARLSKEAQRDALLDRLRAQGRIRLGAGTIVAVFDARDAILRSGEMTGTVKAVFAPDADDEIVRRAAAAKGGVSVVTADLRLRARLSQDVGRHVVFRDTAELWSPTKGSTQGGVVREEGLSRKDAKDITTELREIWLDDEE